MSLLFTVDCKWSPFSDWSECSMTCDGGQKLASRMIVNPALYGGKSCVGEGFITEKCNEQPCPGKILLKYKLYLFKLRLYELSRTSANNLEDFLFS